MKKIILAADIGYGNVKATWGTDCSPESEIVFRSIANLVSKSSTDEVLVTASRVPIVVDSDTFLVGPDAYMSAGNSIGDIDYIARKEYRAFLRGAMHYMFCKTGVYHTIDILVLGLPVGNFASHNVELKKIGKGVHEIPTPPLLAKGLGPTVRVQVDKVIVLPQPIGALSVFSTKCARANTDMGSSLIIDPGYKTLDWVFSNGMYVDMARSGSFGGGVSALLREISGLVGKKLGTGYIDLFEVEKALSSGRIFAGGRFYDFTPFEGIVKEASAKVVDKFFSALDLDREFNSIVLTGGGAQYYRDAIGEKFPGHIIQCADDSIMDNVRGFYMVARGDEF